MTDRLSALRTRCRALPPEKSSGTHSSKRLSKPQGLVRLEGLGELKKIQLPYREFEPVTFRLEAWGCLLIYNCTKYAKHNVMSENKP
jgi:hypothetical protein